jgi:hypothetical protein
MRIVPPSWMRIDLACDEVRFSTESLSITTQPVVHLAPSRGLLLDSLFGHRIRGVGATVPAGTVHSVRVFERAAPPPGYTRERCLGCFFRFGMAHLINKYLFRPRPFVRVTGASQLYPTIGTDTPELIRRALQYAGAARIEGLDGAGGSFAA